MTREMGTLLPVHPLQVTHPHSHHQALLKSPN